MRLLPTILLLCISIAALSQPLRDINYNYLYDASVPFRFTMQPVRSTDGWQILYSLQVNDSSLIKRFEVRWEKRDNISQKEGQPLELTQATLTKTSDGIQGKFYLPNAPSIVAAFILDKEQKAGRYFYRTLDSNYPTTTFLFSNKAEIDRFVYSGNELVPGDSGEWIVSYYNDKFPPAAPPFSAGLARVSKGIQPDSTFLTSPRMPHAYREKGLYLFQKDTLKAEGVAIRVEDDYPRYRQVKNLPGPFIYICTKEEYDRLEIASADKKTFDKTVLTIAGDADQARNLIKNYFRRVEIANQYFTSYKEGWKTDRGMIYIVFGVPDRVLKSYDNEVWEYENERFEVSFTFTKAPSVFDPDNYVLIRDIKYKEAWYAEIDLWRKGLKFVDSPK